jgi:hypothetical protein
MGNTKKIDWRSTNAREFLDEGFSLWMPMGY